MEPIKTPNDLPKCEKWICPHCGQISVRPKKLGMVYTCPNEQCHDVTLKLVKVEKEK